MTMETKRDLALRDKKTFVFLDNILQITHPSFCFSWLFLKFSSKLVKEIFINTYLYVFVHLSI